MSTHTPGKWFAVEPNPEAAWYRGQTYWSVSYKNGNASGFLGAEVAQITSLNTGHEEANARLIAAAPELLEMVGLLADYDSCETEYDGRMLSICPSCGKQDGVHTKQCDFEKARALIAKATGSAS